jgi:hypothetical protein
MTKTVAEQNPPSVDLAARAGDWEHAHRVLVNFDAPMVSIWIRYLGLIDCDIVKRELEEAASATIRNEFAAALTTLWVCGFYEVLRTMRDMNKRSPTVFENVFGLQWDILGSLYSDVEIIRIPLAKQEVAGRRKVQYVLDWATAFNPEGDVTSYVFPSFDSFGGLNGYAYSTFDRVGRRISVSRRDLANRFLSTMRALPPSKRQQRQLELLRARDAKQRE